MLLDAWLGDRLLVGFRQGMLFSALKSRVWHSLGFEHGQSWVTRFPSLGHFPHFN